MSEVHERCSLCGGPRSWPMGTDMHPEWCRMCMLEKAQKLLDERLSRLTRNAVVRVWKDDDLRKLGWAPLPLSKEDYETMLKSAKRVN